jgi:hypothetical protein
LQQNKSNPRRIRTNTPPPTAPPMMYFLLLELVDESPLWIDAAVGVG